MIKKFIRYLVFAVVLILSILSVSLPIQASSPINTNVTASSDDGYYYGTTINLVATYWDMGSTAVGLNGLVRFSSVDIPKGATITVSYITFTSKYSDSGDTCNVIIYGENPTTDNATSPATYTTYANASGRTLTSDNVTWSALGHWTAGSTYPTPSLNILIKGIISNGTWASGYPMAFQFRNNGSSVNAYRRPDSYDNGSGAAMLHIEYITGFKRSFGTIVGN